MPLSDVIDITLVDGPRVEVGNVTLLEAGIIGVHDAASISFDPSPELPGVDDVQAAIDALLGGIGLSDNYVTLATAQDITGAKTFTANPIFNDAAIPQAKVAGLPAALAALVQGDVDLNAELDALTGTVAVLDAAVVHKAGAETITGAKTFAAGVDLQTVPPNNLTPEIRWRDAGGFVAGRVYTEFVAGTFINWMKFRNSGRYDFDADVSMAGQFTATGSALFSPSNAGGFPLVVRGFAGQTASLTAWQSNVGAALASIDAAGRYVGPGASLTSTAVGAIPATVKGFAGQTGDLTQWQDSAAAVLAKVSSAGRLTAAGITAAVANNTDALLVDDTVNDWALRVDASGRLRIRDVTGNLAPVYIEGGVSENLLYLDSSGGGQIGVGTTGPTSKLDVRGSAVGSVTLVARAVAAQTASIQHWQDSAGTALAWVNELGNGVFKKIGAGTSTTIGARQMEVLTQTASDVGLLVRGAASQTGNLQEWQNSAATTLLKVDPAGSLIAGAGSVNFQTNFLTDLANTNAFFGMADTGFGVRLTNRVAANHALGVRAAAAQTGDIQQWLTSAGGVLASLKSDGAIASPGNVQNVFANGGTALAAVLTVGTGAAGRGGVWIKSVASQTADPFEVQDSAGAIVAKIEAAGYAQAIAGTFGLSASRIANNALSGQAGSSATIPLIAKAAAGQTASMTQWQDSSGGLLALIDASGRFQNRTSSSVAIQAATSGGLNQVSLSADTPGLHFHDAAGTRDTSITRTSANVMKGPKAHFGATTASATYVVAGVSGAVGEVPLLGRGFAGQTGNLQEWQDSAAAVLAAITAAGMHKWAAANEQTTIGAAGGAAALPATPTKFLKVKDSAGTTLVIPAYAAA